MRPGILGSGSGSNMQALLDAIAEEAQAEAAAAMKEAGVGLASRAVS